MNMIKIKIALLITLFALSAQLFANRNDHSQILDEVQYHIDSHNWADAKDLINFFQNSSSDQGSLVAYQIDKFDVLVSQVLRDEKSLYEQLRVNFSQSKAQDYLDQYPYGIYYDQVSRLIHAKDEEHAWKQAKSKNTYNSYKRYLSLYNNGKYSSQANQFIINMEESEYQKAIDDNSASSLANFLRRYPNSQHYSDIKNHKTKLSQEYEYNQAVIHNSISVYENFLIKYPSGPYSTEIKNRLNIEYLDNGNYAFSGKNYVTAKYNYEKFLHLNDDPTLQKTVQAKLDICNKYAHQSGALVSMFTMDTSQSAGYTFAQLDTAIPGFYFSIKIKPEAINSEHFETTDDNGNYSGRNPGIATGDSKSTRFAIATGMTYQFKYPIWAYMGAGFEFRSRYDEIETTDIFDEIKFVWVENTDQSKVFIAPEIGFIFKQEGFVLNYGIRYTDELIHQVGLGMAF
ncbi:MAG: hypothetical protein HRU38_05485 [Saccharospirillaceae bacterium]|nr:hypothetical protein [Pseudomonadales bacterium]NRB78109.1 hypothetical protein [Saccharospirillaceae bacterium]